LGADPGALLRLTTACDTRRERLVEVLVPGGEESGCMSALENALQPARTGVIIKSLPAPADTGAALAAAAALRRELLRSAE
ncbi:MAG TPA: hypothetical protein PLP58_09290, partial [Prosthecobacter sp.]|nr:hypothetical protein [Prosthecobacter sp.]